MDFLLFICLNYNVKSWGTTELYIRQFQQLYTTKTGQYMDRNDAKEVYKVRQLCSLHVLKGELLIIEVSSQCSCAPVWSTGAQSGRQTGAECR